METLEGNIAIAFFMGGIVDPDANSWICKVKGIPNGKFSFHKEQGEYHTSWDWLMPIVEKIEGLGYEVQIGKHLFRKDTHCCMIHDAGNALCIEIENDVTKINIVWQACVEFILWYNTTLNK